MVAIQDHTWEQGEDLIIEIVYTVTEGDTQIPVPLDTETFAVRMDIAQISKLNEPVYSFNSDDLSDSNLDSDGEDDNEIIFPSERPGTIHIEVPRQLTLPGGVIGDELSSSKVYGYDLFIRNKFEDVQRKLLKGKIVVNTSITHWP